MLNSNEPEPKAKSFRKRHPALFAFGLVLVLRGRGGPVPAEAVLVGVEAGLGRREFATVAVHGTSSNCSGSSRRIRMKKCKDFLTPL